MKALRRLKAVVLLVAVLSLFAGMLTVMFSGEAQARPKCCLWVMMCTVEEPIVCWEECHPIPCPR